MKEETKEILKGMKKANNEDCNLWLVNESVKLLYNYITNLQKENEELKKNQRLTPEQRQHLHLELDEMIEIYKERIDKAIEYMKERKKYSGDIFYLDEIQTEILYKILNGGKDDMDK